MKDLTRLQLLLNGLTSTLQTGVGTAKRILKNMNPQNVLTCVLSIVKAMSVLLLSLLITCTMMVQWSMDLLQQFLQGAYEKLQNYK